MRKFFNTTLLNTGASLFLVDYMLGHQLDSTHEAYFIGNPKKIREMYQNYIPYLTIQKEADISESPEYLRIKQENQILVAETARHVVERSELQELRAEMEKMKEAKEDTDKVKEFVLLLQKTDPNVLNTIFKALSNVKS
jgi:hypothetical protein